MSLLTIQGLGFDYGGHVVLDGANLTLHRGERYGLVGVNGAGKSTLMRLIAGELAAVSGKVERAARVSVGYLKQDTAMQSGESVIDAVRERAFGDLLEIEARLSVLTQRMGEGDDDPALLDEYGKLHERFEGSDGYTMDSRTESALLGLGFEMDRLDQPVNTLSGGQKRRAALAAILLAPHDVLLLDEPTNHLDLEAREWLEAHLAERKGAVMVISHDRAFLDNATQFTLHLVKARLRRYSGGYTRFLKQWDEERVQWEEQYRRQQEHIEKTEAFIRKHIAGVRTQQAKSRRKQLAHLDRIEAPPGEGIELKIHLESRRPSGSVVLETHGVGMAFDGLSLYSGVDLQILRGEKVGILGPNGTGKTTLLRILARQLVPTEGRLQLGNNVDIGYYDQELSLVQDGRTLLEEIRSVEPAASDGDLRSLLGAFGFSGDTVEQKVGTLSGGERARLSLLHLILERHNTLLLDEPTNHLDTDTREALEAALTTFDGTLVVVSHDRYFLNRICNRIVAFEARAGGGDARVWQVLGNYDDYRRSVQAERQAPTVAPPAPEPVAAPRPAPTRKRDFSKNELRKVRREAQDLEDEITLLEADLESMGAKMSGGDRDMADLARRAQELQKSLDAKMERWEELTALLERDPGEGPA